MRDTYLRSISTEERNILHMLMEEEKGGNKLDKSGYRAKIILLKDEGYTVPERRRGLLIVMTMTSESGYIIVLMKTVSMG